MFEAIDVSRGHAKVEGSTFLQVAGFVGFSYVLNGLAQWTPGYAASGLAQGLPTGSGDTLTDLGLALVQYAIIPGLSEELLFRGLIFAILVKVRGPGSAVLGSAILFGAIHLDPHHAVVATLLGLQLGLIRHLHGLPIAVAAHVANNTAFILATSLIHPEGSGVSSSHLTISAFASFATASVTAGVAWAVLVQRLRNSSASAAPNPTDLQTTRGLDE
jgi:hypothetical protein